ncbi:MAG TPA: hypothetical protein PK604_07035 [Acetivibrio clariflavus]|nr:hypothetical protein [Acetivibrio clariflavus]
MSAIALFNLIDISKLEELKIKSGSKPKKVGFVKLRTSFWITWIIIQRN